MLVVKELHQDLWTFLTNDSLRPSIISQNATAPKHKYFQVNKTICLIISQNATAPKRKGRRIRFF